VIERLTAVARVWFHYGAKRFGRWGRICKLRGRNHDLAHLLACSSDRSAKVQFTNTVEYDTEPRVEHGG